LSFFHFVGQDVHRIQYLYLLARTHGSQKWIIAHRFFAMVIAILLKLSALLHVCEAKSQWSSMVFDFARLAQCPHGSCFLGNACLAVASLATRVWLLLPWQRVFGCCGALGCIKRLEVLRACGVHQEYSPSPQAGFEPTRSHLHA
jgi:hypothetical protein